ncbi:MAG: pilus assembly protein PilM [Arenicellales bacterium]|jgi:type IV pilus assembly protein PilN|nr:hypothetical protein [Acidiferrobacteraceae bacterium]MDP6289591.1 pilus assembly protein PilM [Arenicellales bacterium]MDP7154947.1 pilus assembly protein PilM [Arenicellales bacterium]MDP7482685.1 pilus assembly protein PilM [Arenicellales bacterium]|tara:strand:- start:5514 stop:7319 length:1806 start_codon:yes stop_codon:yes gene_type:complete
MVFGLGNKKNKKVGTVSRSGSLQTPPEKKSVRNKKKKPAPAKGGFFSHFVGDRDGVVGIDMTASGVRIVELEQKRHKWAVRNSGQGFNNNGSGDTDLNEVAEDHVETIKRVFAQKKIKNTNVALAIPVTGSIIRTINMPLMSDQELQEAVKTESLWENMVEMTEEFGKYSVFWHVISRQPNENTMSLLFVAAKLEEINIYVGIARAAGLNPVVVDSRCMAIRDSLAMRPDVDFDEQAIAVLEVGPVENYVAIYLNGVPEITDLYVSDHDKHKLAEIDLTSENADGIMQRFAMQIRQCLSAFEDTHKTTLDKVFLVSALPEFGSAANFLRSDLEGYQVEVPDPFVNLKRAGTEEERRSSRNLSGYSAVIGLATRKLDIFGYYLSSSALSAINLLPERESVRKTEKLKFFTRFGIGLLALVVLAGCGWTYLETQKQGRLLQQSVGKYAELQFETSELQQQLDQIITKKAALQSKLDASRDIYTNKTVMYEMLIEVNQSVPEGVWLTRISYGAGNEGDNADELLIEGKSVNDENIVEFIGNLAGKSHVSQASLLSMTLPREEQTIEAGRRGVTAKNFKLRCRLTGIHEELLSQGLTPSQPGGGQ